MKEMNMAIDTNNATAQSTSGRNLKQTIIRWLAVALIVIFVPGGIPLVLMSRGWKQILSRFNKGTIAPIIENSLSPDLM
jgi:hypothetical protein